MLSHVVVSCSHVALCRLAQQVVQRWDMVEVCNSWDAICLSWYGEPLLPGSS